MCLYPLSLFFDPDRSLLRSSFIAVRHWCRKFGTSSDSPLEVGLGASSLKQHTYSINLPVWPDSHYSQWNWAAWDWWRYVTVDQQTPQYTKQWSLDNFVASTTMNTRYKLFCSCIHKCCPFALTLTISILIPFWTLHGNMPCGLGIAKVRGFCSTFQVTISTVHIPQRVWHFYSRFNLPEYMPMVP